MRAMIVSAALTILKDPDWWQVILIVAGTIIATMAFRSEREAVRLTQRADVLITTVDVSTGNMLAPATAISLRFRNHGPTRADNLNVTAMLGVEGTPTRGPAFGIPTITLAGNETVSVTFQPLQTCTTDASLAAVANGTATLGFFGTVDYADVFGSSHTHKFKGTWRPNVNCFVVDQKEAD